MEWAAVTSEGRELRAERGRSVLLLLQVGKPRLKGASRRPLCNILNNLSLTDSTCPHVYRLRTNLGR